MPKSQNTFIHLINICTKNQTEQLHGTIEDPDIIQVILLT